MKISKYTGTDMRQALRLVREDLGPEAVILSSRRLAKGVEVTAAIDHDVAEQSPGASSVSSDPRFESEEFVQLSSAALARVKSDGAKQPSALLAPPLASVTAALSVASVAPSARPYENIPVAYAAGTEPAPSAEGVNEELRTLRRILETQVAQLAWNDLTRRAPIHTEVLRELTHFGFTQEFAAQIVAQLPTRLDLTQARRLAIAASSQKILVTGDRWLESGGRVALIGPTGVGKTTTLTKLAVRWVLRHGPRDLALISADSARIGAHDTIAALGQMLGVGVNCIDSLAQLPELLAQLSHHRMVLLDTAGLSQRDTQLSARLGELSASGAQLETALVLSASTQAGAIEEILARFASAKSASCILTKLDEAASLGGILSALSRAQLAIAYVCEGQRIPEDMRPARALELVSSAVQLAQASGATADEDLLRRRFGEIAHALA